MHVNNRTREYRRNQARPHEGKRPRVVRQGTIIVSRNASRFAWVSMCDGDAYDWLLVPGQEPPLGAHIVTLRRGFTHHGIYVGRDAVVQYGGLARGLRRAPAEEVPLAEFTLG